MDAELAPFMRGEFLIFDMRLVRPKMNVSVDADGKVDWAMRPSSPFDPAQIAIEKLTITEGQVRIRHATSGRDHLVSEINAEVSAKSLDGPWRADGSLRLDGMRTAIGLSTGKVDEKGALRLRIKADPAIYPVAIESRRRRDHRTRRGANMPGTCISRRATIRRPAAPASERGARQAGQGRAAGMARPRQLRARPCAARPRRIPLRDRPADDPYTADGKAYVELDANPRFSVTATGAQVRFDEAMVADKDPAGLTLQDRIARDPGSAARPAEAVDPRARSTSTCRRWWPATRRSATSRCRPSRRRTAGRSRRCRRRCRDARRSKASGLLKTGENDFGFAGSLLVAVGQPSGFAAWLSKDVDEAIRRLPAAGFKADGRSHHGAPVVQRSGAHPRQGEIPGRDRKQRAERRQPVDAGGAHRRCARCRRAGGVLVAVRQRAAAASVSPTATSTSRSRPGRSAPAA